MFNAMKDTMAGTAARHYVNKLVQRYGEVTELRIDSRRRTVDLVARLRGEEAPVTIRVDRYEVEDRDGHRFVRIRECSCSRPWLQALLKDFARDRPIEVPGWAASAL